VTGGAGFIGSHLVEELVKMSIKVTIVDNLSNGSKENLREVWKDIRFIQEDISKDNLSVEGDFDVIFHLAAHPRSFSLIDPYRNIEVNVKGTLNILEIARRNGCKVIYTSNSGIYGEPKFLPVNESHPDDPNTPYDVTKLAAEDLVKIYHRIYGVPCVIFRLATVYGERQRVNEKLKWRPVVPEFVGKVLNNESPVIHGDGEQTRDFIYVEDVIKGLILGAKSSKGNGEVMILSTGKETSINKLLKEIMTITGIDVEPRYEPPLPGDIRRMVYSFNKAKTLINYEPSYSLEMGLRAYIRWLQESDERKNF